METVPEGCKSSQDRKVNPKKKEKREEEEEEENGRRISTGGNVSTREKKIYTRYSAESGKRKHVWSIYEVRVRG